MVIPVYFLPAAMALRLVGEARYVLAVVRGQARPNPVSWFCWGLAPLVAFAAQLSHGLRPTEWMTLVIAIGPVAVVVAAAVKGGITSRVAAPDLACGAVSLAGLVAWLVTSRPAAALLLSIVADLVAGVPTFRQAYRRPMDECAPTYLISTVAMAITVLTVHRWTIGQIVLPAYILAVNAALYAVIRIRTAYWKRMGRSSRTAIRQRSANRSRTGSPLTSKKHSFNAAGTRSNSFASSVGQPSGRGSGGSLANSASIVDSSRSSSAASAGVHSPSSSSWSMRTGNLVPQPSGSKRPVTASRNRPKSE